jgi:hypothetical protein
MTMMNLDRFAALVDAYGASPARWPEGERAAAVELMQTSAEARRLAEEADRLDRLLDTPQTAPVTRALQDRILAALASRGPAPRGSRITLGRWLPAGAVACSLLLGLAIGTQVPALAGLDEDTLAQNAAMSASASDAWPGEYE